jgi:hypothetical protein
LGLVVASQLETRQPVDEGVPEEVVDENGGCVVISSKAIVVLGLGGNWECNKG